MTPTQTSPYVMSFDDIDRTHLRLVGGKGTNLGELSKVDAVHVPAGFCVTTDAFSRVVGDDPSINALLDQLVAADANDRSAIADIAAQIRRNIGCVTIPDDVTADITAALSAISDGSGYAVRSSATVEDLPTASFAGQHDSYLNVTGTDAVLDHTRRCWASLFTERAVSYRAQHGMDRRYVAMAVVVQQMVDPDASGVLFTADPVTSNRTVCAVEAVVGLGEALVSGTVSADAYTVHGGVVEMSIATKTTAIETAPAGGTQQVMVESDRQHQPVLTDAQVLELVELGRQIQTHFGTPQDIEWCLAGDRFAIVQSRPITTLFPIPESTDDENHVYVSVGHQQMMTEPMKPLGLSFWQMTTPAPMAEAGGRLFVDVTARLGSPAARKGVLGLLGKSDPLIQDALQTVLDRGDFVATSSEDTPVAAPPWAGPPEPLETDPAIVDDLVAQWRASLEHLRREIRLTSGTELFDFIKSDLASLRELLFEPRSIQVIMAAIDATWWLNDHLLDWLGEHNVADTLTLSAPGNVTSEMGLALLDVADTVRPHPEVVKYLELLDDTSDHPSHLLDELADLPGGRTAQGAIKGFLDQYGMRCVGEIDITRPRWTEHPDALVPVILGHVRNVGPGEATRRFDHGLQAAARKEVEVLERLRALPDGESKAAETKQMIDRVRTFIGYREYPKYAWMGRFFEYRQALLAEADWLRRDGAISDVEDIYFLSFDELHDAVRTASVDHDLVAGRRDAFESYQSLTPPRVLTSDGEALTGAYHRDDLPSGALPGIAVSTGIVEGRARVIHDMADADIEPGDILVTAHTDPSWSPLFVAISGLVTEVGGLMTHGAVVAREYGLPAVVGVEHATRRITDGQRIRLDGTNGHVEILL